MDLDDFQVSNESAASPPPASPSEPARNLVAFTTPPNTYRVYHEYPTRGPSYTPDDLHSLEQVADGPNFAHAASSSTTKHP